ncbi:BEM_collapsed_G0027900.mRNA.1.CDS.1 [Saccharomyces cerevisiae]|nr:BEM_HP_G0170580.mRNA.1.CDS.1 [Saccharomyces cerevisiae]CAI5000100.1 BEM_HP_G0011730.mRNA.1.CDS.1 [Saccharomyces cerevisiae]CAI6846986.1 BEM_HP_G0170580.mRNA.1.CDS.1 [Saccharomyces cerevisiae]CAI6901153.1 BEM_HP_G0011730.mRNA.1.CDS.1 [Saccharomyces cerevisiae]CAI7093201.1 BEM_collapsed_G0027900.mRNA.1.CDS.1 [Saccharomyces cerevisiae]
MAPKAFFVCLPWVLPRHALIVRQAGNPYHFLAYTRTRVRLVNCRILIVRFSLWE